MCIAPFVAMLLRNPEEIVRTDGKAVMDFPKESFAKYAPSTFIACVV